MKRQFYAHRTKVQNPKTFGEQYHERYAATNHVWQAVAWFFISGAFAAAIVATVVQGTEKAPGPPTTCECR